MSSFGPLRRCVGCRRSDEQSALRRYVRRDGLLVLDDRRRVPGRGAWVHPDPQCWERALHGGFARNFRAPVPPEAVDRPPF